MATLNIELVEHTDSCLHELFHEKFLKCDISVALFLLTIPSFYDVTYNLIVHSCNFTPIDDKHSSQLKSFHLSKNGIYTDKKYFIFERNKRE